MRGQNNTGRYTQRQSGKTASGTEQSPGETGPGAGLNAGLCAHIEFLILNLDVAAISL
jgi:hypothetical protein